MVYAFACHIFAIGFLKQRGLNSIQGNSTPHCLSQIGELLFLIWRSFSVSNVIGVLTVKSPTFQRESTCTVNRQSSSEMWCTISNNIYMD